MDAPDDDARDTTTMTATKTTKAVLRAALAAPGIRDGLRWFINHPAIPTPWRTLAHRKLAKRARFGDGRAFPYTTPDGIALRFLHGGTPDYLYWLGTYEPDTTSLFCALAARARTILDIGTADGIYAILAAAANPSARIFAFEPGAAAARTCATNLKLNLPITRQVELHALALGDAEGVATLYVAGEAGGTSSLSADFRSDRVEERVVVRTGDSVVAELGIERVDLIKMDTESTEPAVLRGLAETLRRDTPDIVCEVLFGRTEADLERLLAPLGYGYFAVTDQGLVRREQITGDSTYRHPNYLFTKRSTASLTEAGLVVR